MVGLEGFPLQTLAKIAFASEWDFCACDFVSNDKNILFIKIKGYIFGWLYNVAVSENLMACAALVAAQGCAPPIPRPIKALFANVPSQAKPAYE